MSQSKLSFFQRLHQDYNQFLETAQQGIDLENCLRIDLHCHDKNSDKPDELYGRLLRLPETWLKTKTLIKQLERSGCSLLTITNHNNATSCWDANKERDDFIVGAEFTCHFPDVDLSVHVLCYGFTPVQEETLNELRHNAYDFVRYTRNNHIPVVLPHPLFFYSRETEPTLDILERFAVMFERFEVLNGQRGVWQNSLTRDWVNSLTPDYIDQCAVKLGLDPNDFCFDPYRKRMTGGSDDHFGQFAGSCGTLLPIRNLKERIASGEKPKDLAIEALLHGDLVPFGEVGEEEKLTAAFLDYFAQVVINMKDPGLVRLMLHKGDTKDKLICLGISNAVQELQRHKYTLKFLETFHEALQGKKPALLVSLNTSKEFKPVLKVIKAIARAKRTDPRNFAESLRTLIPDLQRHLSTIFFDRLNTELSGIMNQVGSGDEQFKATLKGFELPTHFRSLVGQKPASGKNMSSLNLGDAFDQLSFPLLAASVVLGAGFMATHVLYKNRQFINQLATSLEERELPQRVLWLTDTLVDKNGVSTALSQTLDSIRELDLPIDILTCHPTLESSSHLHVVRPISQLSLPNVDEQILYVPDILKIQQIFEQGGYDKVICSTELLMGSVALYLKHAFAVEAHFFMHTDWLEYAEQRIQPSEAMHNRLRRMLRGFYQAFDGVITLNEEHQALLTSSEFELPEESVIRSAHWPAKAFTEAEAIPEMSSRPLRVIYTGRLSPEKGVRDLPKVWERVKKAIPNAELVLAGTGPIADELKHKLPEARFTGWLSQEELIEELKHARCQILPSRFDTFGCVVVEAMCLGVPTVAYNCKGPKTIIEQSQAGMLVEHEESMGDAIVELLSDESKASQLSAKAKVNSQQWSDSEILNNILEHLHRSPTMSCH